MLYWQSLLFLYCQLLIINIINHELVIIKAKMFDLYSCGLHQYMIFGIFFIAWVIVSVFPKPITKINLKTPNQSNNGSVGKKVYKIVLINSNN